MTMIAHFRSFGVPTLIGDLLISSASNPGRQVHLPASRNINERIYLPPNYYVIGLSQKLVLINESLAVAWSGNYAQAANIFSSLEPLRHIEVVDPTHVQAFIAGVDNSLKSDLSLMALVSTPAGPELLTHRVEPFRDYGPIAHVACSGTGHQLFHRLMDQLSANILTANPGVSPDELREGFDINFLGSLEGEEFASTIPLRQRWGGGFEVARLVGGHITKVGKQLSLRFLIRREAQAFSLWLVPNFRHTDYTQGLTVVQAVEHEVGSDGSVLPGRRDIFVVTSPGSQNPD